MVQLRYRSGSVTFNGIFSGAWLKCAKKRSWRIRMCWRGPRKRLRRLAGVLADVERKEFVHKEHHAAKHRFFLRRVVSEKEGMGAVTFTFVCEHCKLFPVEDFLWWVSANHGETKKKTKNSKSGSQIACSRCKSETQPLTTQSSRHAVRLESAITCSCC